MTTCEIAGRTIHITEAPRFNRRRPARYIFTIEGTPDYAQDLDATYATEADALTAAQRYLGVTTTTGACPCGKPATMNASRGATCTDCYDNYSD